jgi:hypothetical protein
MAEEQEIRATHDEVEGFVGKLQGFYGSLSASEQAMMDTIPGSAQGGETGAYRRMRRSGEDQPEAWQDLIGWIKEQGEEDTQGFRIKMR